MIDQDHFSLDTITGEFIEKNGDNLILAAPTELYVSNVGNDTTGDGTESSPLATIEKAISQLVNDGTIWVMNEISVTSGVAITIKRISGFTGALVNVMAPDSNVMTTLALENITIDRNKVNVTNAQSALITVKGNCSLNLNVGAILESNKNNRNSDTDGGGVYVEASVPHETDSWENANTVFNNNASANILNNTPDNIC